MGERPCRPSVELVAEVRPDGSAHPAAVRCSLTEIEMRKVFWQMMVSLDGFMEGPNGELDWHVVDDDFMRYVMEYGEGDRHHPLRARDVSDDGVVLADRELDIARLERAYSEK